MIIIIKVGDLNPSNRKTTNHLDIADVVSRGNLDLVRGRGLGEKEHEFIAIEFDSSGLTNKKYRRIAQYLTAPKINGQGEIIRKRYCVLNIKRLNNVHPGIAALVNAISVNITAQAKIIAGIQRMRVGKDHGLSGGILEVGKIRKRKKEVMLVPGGMVELGKMIRNVSIRKRILNDPKYPDYVPPAGRRQI